MPPSPLPKQPPCYHTPGRLLLPVLVSLLTLRPRSLARDGRTALTAAGRFPIVEGGETIPARGPGAVVCNHYTRPGFPAWWLAMVLSATVAGYRAAGAEAEICWVMTAAWTFPGHPCQRRFLTPLTRWAFRRVAQVYGFVSMPPMPPTPREVASRAKAVREVLGVARRAAKRGGLLGLAPEGRDVEGRLGPLPAGAGRFLVLLVQAGLPLLPVGVSERAGHLLLSFGPAFRPQLPPDPEDVDLAVAGQVLAAIARLLPASGSHSGGTADLRVAR